MINKIAIFAIIIFIFSSCSKTEYKIKIAFCDNRPPVYTTTIRYSVPTMNDIQSERYIPCFHTENYEYLNVCDIDVLSSTKINK